jgi:hypothetical protein
MVFILAAICYLFTQNMPPVLSLMYQVPSPEGRWLAQVYSAVYIDHMWAGHPWCEVCVTNTSLQADPATIYVSNWMNGGKVDVSWRAPNVLVIRDEEMNIDYISEHPIVKVVGLGMAELEFANPPSKPSTNEIEHAQTHADRTRQKA